MGVKEIFGNNLRRFRKKNKYTQEKLAELAGITPQHLGVIERGEAFVSADLFEKFSEILEVPFTAFLHSNIDNSLSEKVDNIIEKEMIETAAKLKDEIKNYL